MVLLKMALVAAMLLSISGCSAFGVPYTSDPSKKLNYSYQLMANGRFIPAERLIGEALEIYQEKKDEAGIAEAYHTYGNLYKHDWFAKTKQYKSYSEFMDIRQNGIKLSKEYFEKAVRLFNKQQDFMGISKSYFGIASVYGVQDDMGNACKWWDKSLEAYNKGKAKNPEATLNMLSGFKDMPEMIAAFKKKFNC